MSIVTEMIEIVKVIKNNDPILFTRLAIDGLKKIYKEARITDVAYQFSGTPFIDDEFTMRLHVLALEELTSRADLDEINETLDHEEKHGTPYAEERYFQYLKYSLWDEKFSKGRR